MATAVIHIQGVGKDGKMFFEIERGRVIKIIYFEIEDFYRKLTFSPKGTLLSIALKSSMWTSTDMKEELLKEWNDFAVTEMAKFTGEHLSE